MNSFLLDNNSFINYSPEHFICLIAIVLTGVYLLTIAKKHYSLNVHHKLMIAFAAIICFSQIFKSCIRVYIGNFNILTDLPLELCNILTFLMLFTLLTKSRWLWGVIFFWIMSGTFQALFTPTLLQSFPNYEFWRYWLVHGGLVICALYPLMIMRWSLNWKDVLRSMIGLNLLAFVMYHFNNFLGSNYMYLNKKPGGDTLYSILGEWPTYIFQLEVVMVILFSFWYFVSTLISKRQKAI